MKLSWLLGQLNMVREDFGDIDITMHNFEGSEQWVFHSLGVYDGNVIFTFARPGNDICPICHCRYGKCRHTEVKKLEDYR